MSKMPAPPTIYECPVCGTWSEDADYTGGHDFARFPDCHRNQRVPVRVFREEDVRPLWEELRDARRIPSAIAALPGIGRALDAFPAPEEWSRRAEPAASSANEETR
jgi:hypothetical protein